MLKEKYRTTSLIPPEERPPLDEIPVRKPSFFRFAWILRKVLPLMFRYFRLKIRGQTDPITWAVEIRRFVESMGGVWIKAGQVLAMRNDLFSLEFCNELGNMQDRAYAFPAEESVRLIEEHLGRPIHQVFDDFEEKPFAAASLSQVHRARLRRKGVKVAIKIQRPHALSTFHYDLWWLARLFDVFQFFDIMDHYHWDEMLVEVRNMMEEELDYRQEAANIKEFKKNLKRHKIYVPKVFIHLSTDKLLVMEFIDGVFMSEYVKMYRNDPGRLNTWLSENKVNTKKVARRLFHSQLRQIYEDLIFHGDLHPGNIVLLRNSRLAFIDFGNAGRFDKEFAHKYNLYLRAFANGEMSTAADLYLVMAGQLSPHLDIARVKRDLIKAFYNHQIRSRLKNLPFQERSLAGNAAELSQIAATYKFEINWNLLKMGRALGAIDQNMGVLYPAVDYNKETEDYLKAKAVRGKDQAQLLNIVPELVNKMNDMSTLMMPTILSKTMQFGGMIDSTTSMLAFVMRLFSRFFWIALIVFAWVYLYQHHFSLVGDLHQDKNYLVRWIESVPKLDKFSWYAALALAAFVNLRIISFVRNILQPSARLPGDSPGSR